MSKLTKTDKALMWVIGIFCFIEALLISAHWGYCYAQPDFWYCF